MQYIVNWNSNFHHKNPHVLLDPPSKLELDKSIRIKIFEFSWSPAITATHYTYLNLLNKKHWPPLNTNTKLFHYPFGFCYYRWKFSHGGWCCYALKSSSCVKRRRRTWRNTPWCECFPTITRRITIPKNGAHSSQSLGMGSLIISYSTCFINLFRVSSCLWKCTKKVWRVSMWRWQCSSSLSNLGSRWWSLLLATRPNQPPFHGTSSWMPSLHHLSHFKFFAVVIYPF